MLTGAVIPVTTAVGADWALADPSPFVAVSSTRRVRADVVGLDDVGLSRRRRRSDVQPPPVASQRCHASAKVIGGVPVHEPGTAVSVSPTTAVPVMAGGVVLDGVAVERASAPALRSAATVTAAASTALDGNVQRRARATRTGRFSSDMVDSSWLRLSPLTSTHAVHVRIRTRPR